MTKFALFSKSEIFLNTFVQSNVSTDTSKAKATLLKNSISILASFKLFVKKKETALNFLDISSL